MHDYLIKDQAFALKQTAEFKCQTTLIYYFLSLKWNFRGDHGFFFSPSFFGYVLKIVKQYVDLTMSYSLL